MSSLIQAMPTAGEKWGTGQGVTVKGYNFEYTKCYQLAYSSNRWIVYSASYLRNTSCSEFAIMVWSNMEKTRVPLTVGTQMCAAKDTFRVKSQVILAMDDCSQNSLNNQVTTDILPDALALGRACSKGDMEAEGQGGQRHLLPSPCQVCHLHHLPSASIAFHLTILTKNMCRAGHQWVIPVILATQEEEIRRIVVQG
jgi:hypothetical protein